MQPTATPGIRRPPRLKRGVGQQIKLLLRARQLFQMNMPRQPLDLVLKFSQGTGELAVATDHPAVAAFRRAMEEGQLTGAWRYLLVHDLPTLPYTIIGTFVKTPKGRVLFFPGAAIAIETDDPSARFNGKRLDHITADPPGSVETSSHVAVHDLPHNKSRGVNYRSAPPPEHMFPWFSFLLPDLAGFAKLPAQLVVRFPPPPVTSMTSGKDCWLTETLPASPFRLRQVLAQRTNSSMCGSVEERIGKHLRSVRWLGLTSQGLSRTLRRTSRT